MPKRTPPIDKSKVAEIIDILNSGEENDNAGKTVAFFRDMPEEQRRLYAPFILKFCRERQDSSRPHAQDLAILSGDEMLRAAHLARNAGRHWNSIAKAAWQALLATAIPSEIARIDRKQKDHPYFTSQSIDGSFFPVLENRRPGWIEAFILKEFSHQSYFRRGPWLDYRQLYHAGLVSRLLQPEVITGMYLFLQSAFFDPLREKPFSGTEYFRSEKELLEQEVWLLFECPVTINCYADNSHGRRKTDFLHNIFIELSEEGLLSRSRLIDATLDALSRNFGKEQEKWMLEFCKRLSPTSEEQNSRLEKYIDILGSKNFAVTCFAIERISSFVKEGCLGDDVIDIILSSLEPLLLDPAKGRIKKLLAFLEAIVKRMPSSQKRIASMLIDVMFHENPDIQKIAGNLYKMCTNE